MNPEPNQVFIYTNNELSLIKNTFAENDELLYAVRKVFLQFPVTDAEKQMIRSQVTPDVLRVLRKRILPTPSNEFPLGQISGLLTTLTSDLKAKSPEEMELLISAKVSEIAYLEQQFAVLSGEIESEAIKLSEFSNVVGKSKEEAFVSLTVYLFILGFIDPCLLMIKSIAGKKDETLEELTKRMFRDSSK